MNHQIDSDTGLGQTKNISALRELLAVYRVKSKIEREKGTYFEWLIRDSLKHDPPTHPIFPMSGRMQNGRLFKALIPMIKPNPSKKFLNNLNSWCCMKPYVLH
jgi:hypothetical protein